MKNAIFHKVKLKIIEFYKYCGLREWLIMIDYKQKYKNKPKFPYYYCEDLKDCINKNSFVAETRKNLKRKKLEEFNKHSNEDMS